MNDQEDAFPLKEPDGPEPTEQRNTYGSVVSLVLIVGIIVVGAFYMWGERVAQERALPTPAAEGQ